MATFPRGIPPADRVLDPRVRRARGEAEPAPIFRSKLPGDPLALRGIPAIGRGVGGAIGGTSPDRGSRDVM